VGYTTPFPDEIRLLKWTFNDQTLHLIPMVMTQRERQDSGWPDARGRCAQGEFRRRRKRRSPGGSGTGEGEWLDSECGMTQDFAAVAGRSSLRYPWMIR